MRSRFCGMIVALVAGCAAGSAPETVVEPDTISVRFAPGGLANVVVVTTIDRLPLRSAMLVAPDGERVLAYSLDVFASPVIAETPADALALTIPGAYRRVTSVETMISIALIELPDPARYAKTWQGWRVQLRLGDPDAGQRSLMLAAPASPKI